MNGTSDREAIRETDTSLNTPVFGPCSGPDVKAANMATARWNSLAKPVGSLGRLETMITRIAGIQATKDVSVKPRRLIVACADNGIVDQGVAATPPSITAVMADQIADGKSSVALMAKMADCEVSVYDIGMFNRAYSPHIIDGHLADGTADFSTGPAMAKETALKAIRLGMAVAKKAKQDGVHLLATGEMGIGNTTTSAAVAMALTGRDAAVMTGRGAGLSDQAYDKKRRLVHRVVTENKLYEADPLTVLASVGGLDIAMLSGLFIGAARERIPILVDGVISAVAALLAEALCPGASYAFLASHLSAEPAGQIVLERLGLTPLLYADMRLGEGTGAMALLPVIDMAVELYRHLNTFTDIGMVP